MEKNKNVDNEILRAMKIDVEYEKNKEVLHVMPVAHNKGLEIQPATSVDENLPTFDIPVEGYRVENTRKLEEMGMKSDEIKAHQNAVNSRVTDRALIVKGEKTVEQVGQQQSDEPSRGE